MAVIVMAWRRPYYLRETLESWAAVPEIKTVRRFIIGLGPHEREPENRQVIREAEELMQRPIEILVDSERAQASPAMHRPMGEAANFAWADPKVGWTILCEEDDPVSDDVLRYMRWCRDEFENRRDVLLVCAHSLPHVEGWKGPAPAERDTVRETDKDPAIVRLKQGFDSHVWGTWRNRWREVLEPTWDWECNSGTPTTSGIDWNIATRVMPQGRFYAAAPDASRSSNIGKDEGVYMNPGDWRPEPAFSPVYGEVAYRFAEGS
jgi:hypothetical protein